MVVEDPYTDADFLDDFTAYYARCFSAFGRRCKRLHFFRCTVTPESFSALLGKPLQPVEEEALQIAYLGFVVARPLPEKVIGRSVLRTYDDDKGERRHFPVSRSYEVNLFGLNLRVDGLAYQEQDEVLAACATVALWSAFHKTGELFGTAIPTPAVITKAATQASHYGRPIPQHGLRMEEMCSAIRHNGLEPEAVNLQSTSNVPLASLLYGYLRMGLPAILIVEIPGRGWHGITLTGYSQLSIRHRTQEVPGNDAIVPMVGLRIDRFYGHDDQVGPNAKLIVQDTPATPSVSTKCAIRLESAWTDEHGNQLSLYPMAVAVPVYNKIRLTFLDIQKWITPLHALFAKIIPEPTKVEWDIHLTLSNSYKRETRTNSYLTEQVRTSLLVTHHPRFWWRASMRYAGLPFCDLLFDATGIARSFPLSMVVWPVEAFAAFTQQVLDPANPAAPTVRQMLGTDRYVQFLRETLVNRQQPGELLTRHLAS